MVQENEEFLVVTSKKSRGRKKVFKESLSQVVSAEDDSDFNVDNFLK